MSSSRRTGGAREEPTEEGTGLDRGGVFDLLDLELARALSRLAPDAREEVALAIALTSRHVRRGHTCLPLEPAVLQAGVASEEAWPELPNASAWVDALRRSALTQDGPLVIDEGARLYLRRYFEFERDIATELCARAIPLEAVGPSVPTAALDRLVGRAETPRRAAAKRLLEHRISVLCGGPGTGKTTTVAAVAALFAEKHLAATQRQAKILLLAPTGKAAARLGSAVSGAKAKLDASDEVRAALPSEAITVQRALGLRRHGLSFRHGPRNPLDADLIVVDEASMVDLAQMRQLLVSIRKDAHVLLVGDPDQLTSVEAGSVLKDLVRADAETWWTGRVTHLTTTYRYAASETLGQLVSLIREGDADAALSLLDRGDDRVALQDPSSFEAALDEAGTRWEAILRAEGPRAHFTAREGFVVLSPFRRGPYGTVSLGHALERRLENAPTQVRPVIIEANDHDLGVYNGDLGMAFARGGTPFVTVPRDDGEFAEIARVRLPSHTQAFALSVHKAQGSEFDEVLVVLPDADNPLLTRELLYTALSRARRGARVVGPSSVLASAIERPARRFSGLVARIAELNPRA
ncbi:MAG: exodeoxyribonuclease V subunit alpha [Myxococcota bacterium]